MLSNQLTFWQYRQVQVQLVMQNYVLPFKYYVTIPVSTNPCVNKIYENLSKGNNPLGDCDSLLNSFRILIQTVIRARNHLFCTTEIQTLKLHINTLQNAARENLQHYCVLCQENCQCVNLNKTYRQVILNFLLVLIASTEVWKYHNLSW